MRKFLFVSGVVFVAALGVVVGMRISPDAMAVIIGIICGVLASIPTTVILMWVLRQRDRQLDAQLYQGRFANNYPPVVVVNGQGTQGYSNGMPPPLTSSPGPSLPAGREFKVIGQENTENVGDMLPSFWE